MNRFHVASSHRDDAAGPADQLVRKRQTSLLGNVDPKLSENLDGMLTRGLTGKSAHARGSDPDIGPIRHHLTEQTLRHRTSANIPGANKQNILQRRQSTQR
jgi:hypothetical protein